MTGSFLKYLENTSQISRRELEDIMLSEIILEEKDKYKMISLLQGTWQAEAIGLGKHKMKHGLKKVYCFENKNSNRKIMVSVTDHDLNSLTSCRFSYLT